MSNTLTVKPEFDWTRELEKTVVHSFCCGLLLHVFSID